MCLEADMDISRRAWHWSNPSCYVSISVCMCLEAHWLMFTQELDSEAGPSCFHLSLCVSRSWLTNVSSLHKIDMDQQLQHTPPYSHLETLHKDFNSWLSDKTNSLAFLTPIYYLKTWAVHTNKTTELQNTTNYFLVSLSLFHQLLHFWSACEEIIKP